MASGSSQGLRQKTQTSYNLISGVTSHHFCPVPFVRIESLSLYHAHVRRLFRVMNTRRWGIIVDHCGGCLSEMYKEGQSFLGRGDMFQFSSVAKRQRTV